MSQATGPGEARPPAPRRALAHYAAIVAGSALLLLGWYRISGLANPAQQLPYLASATVPGAVLVLAGAFLLAADRSRRSSDRSTEMVHTLYQLLTTAAGGEPHGGVGVGVYHDERADGNGAAGDGDATAGPNVWIEGTGRYHRPACALVTGKRTRVVAIEDVAAHQLEPCPVCDPDTADEPGR